MRNHCDNIKNEIAYFYTVIKNMDKKDTIKKSKIKEHEIPIEEILYDNFSDDFDVDKQSLEQSLLGWIELIENPMLHKAVKSLSIEDQIFISYIVKECRTHRELAQIYGVSYRAIGQRFKRLINKLKNLFKT